MALTERQTRKQLIDPQLASAGWRVVPYERWLSGDRTPADAVEEHPTDSGPGDYLLYLDGRPVADVEAKKAEVSPQEVIGQAKRYSRTLASSPFQFGESRIPFVYSTNGYLIYHADLRSALVMQREVAAFHTPQALRERLSHDFEAADTWLRGHPITDPDRAYQQAAVGAIEAGLRNGKRQMMVAMATGSGKTRMVIASIYRLMKAGFAQRVLFLVDRRALAAQAVGALAAYEPEPGLKFDRIYETYSQRFQREDFEDETGRPFDPKVMPQEYLTDPDGRHAFVYVSTIQRMRINLFGPPTDSVDQEFKVDAESIPQEMQAALLDAADHLGGAHAWGISTRRVLILDPDSQMLVPTVEANLEPFTFAAELADQCLVAIDSIAAVTDFVAYVPLDKLRRVQGGVPALEEDEPRLLMFF